MTNDPFWDAYSQVGKDRLDTSLGQSLKKSPDQAAKVDDLSKRTGAPSETVERNLTAFQEMQRKKEINALDLPNTSPELSGFLSDISNARQSHDDTENLRDLERGFFNNTARRVGERTTELMGQLASFVNQSADYMEQEYGSLGAIYWEEGDILPSFTTETMRDLEARTGTPSAIKQAAKALKATDFDAEHVHTWESVKNAFTDDDTGALSAMGEVLLYAGEQGIASIPDMLATIYAMPAYIPSRAAEIGSERAANKGKEQDIIDTMEAMPFAVGSAMLEKIGATGILKAGSTETIEQLGKGALKQMLAAGAREAGTEFVQEGIIEYLGARIGTGAEMSFAEAGEMGLAGALAGGVYGTAMAGSSAGTRAAIDAIHQRRLRGANDAEKIASITEAAKKTKLRERNSAAFKSFLNKLGTAYDAESVFIDPDGANKFFQETELTEQAMASDAVQRIYPQIAEALETGTPIEIPIEDYIASVAGTELEGLSAHVMLDPDSMTPAQSQDQSLVDQVNEVIELEVEQGARPVFDDIIQKTAAMGWESSRSETSAITVSSMVETLAKRTGKSAQEIWSEYGFDIQNEVSPAIKMRAKAFDDVGGMLDQIRSGEIDPESKGLELVDLLLEAELDPQTMTNDQIIDALTSPDPLGRDIMTQQEFGDLQLSEEMEIAETGERVTVKKSAQKEFTKTAKRRDVVEQLLRCVNG